MNAKKTMVKLKATGTDNTVAFEIAHATNILRMPRSGWELDDNNFIFDGYEIKRRSNTQGGGKTVKDGTNKAGSGAASED